MGKQKREWVTTALWILALAAVIVGCILWYYLWYRRPRPISEVIPVSLEESGRCFGYITRDGYTTEDFPLLTEEQINELERILAEGRCCRSGSGRGMSYPNYTLNIFYPGSETEYVNVMFRKNSVLVNTQFDGTTPSPCYHILDGGEELISFFERMVSAAQ